MDGRSIALQKLKLVNRVVKIIYILVIKQHRRILMDGMDLFSILEYGINIKINPLESIYTSKNSILLI